MFITVFHNFVMITLTIFTDFATISDEFIVNSCVQMEEHAHFYRFCFEMKTTHTVGTDPSDLYREYPPPWGNPALKLLLTCSAHPNLFVAPPFLLFPP